MKLVVWPAMMATVLVGCGTDSQAPQERGNLSTIQREIFTPKCALSGCHGVPLDPAPALNLSQGQSHAALVNVDSKMVDGAKRVVPGDPNASLLFQAVNGTSPPPVTRMPSSSPPLPSADIDAIREWIAAGALDD
jgi:hypothetical protein